MHRQARIVATAGLAALVVTGCSTLDDQSVAGRVGEAEISFEEVAEILEDTPEGAEAADAVRGVTGLFLANELVKLDLSSLGVDAAAADTTGLEPGDALRAEFGANLQVWQSLPAEELADADVEAFYSSGSSGLVCASHILVETEAEAEAVLDELDAGRSFAEVAAEVSTDPGSGAAGGRLGCQPADEFETTFVPEFVEGARPLSIGEVSEPVASSFGFHVITIATFDQLGEQDLLQLRVRQFDERYDIYVAPRIGAWTATADIVPLG